jgi:hypothetical protein
MDDICSPMSARVILLAGKEQELCKGNTHWLDLAGIGKPPL